MSVFFKLKRNLSVPFRAILGGESAAFLTLFKKDYVVSYIRQPGPVGEKAFSLALVIGRLLPDGEKIRFAPEFQLGQITITEEGRNGSVTNQKAVDDYKKALGDAKAGIADARLSLEAALNALKIMNADLSALESALATALAEGNKQEADRLEKAADALFGNIAKAQKERDDASKRVADLEKTVSALESAPVAPTFEVIDTFDEVTQYFERDSSLNAAGIAWGLGLPLPLLGEGVRIGDFIEA